MVKIKNEINLDEEEMMKAGVHLGHKTSKIHPKMQPYLAGVKSGVHIIDVKKTKEKLAEALAFIQNLISEDKTLMIVGTKIQVSGLIDYTAKECGLPYVKDRWLGGTFTNFDAMAKRVAYYKDLEAKKAQGDLEKYTKKERVNFDRELKRLEVKFGGVKNLNKLPDAIFVCDMIKDGLAVKEARARGIKVIGICHTNTDPTMADYPIPANDDASSSVGYILDKVKQTCLNFKSNKSKN